jgi:hypothetical protein
MSGSRRGPIVQVLTFLVGGSLLTLTVAMVAARIVLPDSSPGFGPTASTWLSVLYISAGDLPSWCIVSIFGMSLLGVFALVHLHGLPTVSRLFGWAMTETAALAFATQLLPQPLVDRLGRMIEPLGHCDGEPVSVWQNWPEMAVYWALLVLPSFAAWQIGRGLSAGPSPDRNGNVAWIGILSFSVLVATVAAQNGVTSTPESLLRAILPWSCWAVLSGMLVGWGEDRDPRGNATSPRVKAEEQGDVTRSP